MSLVISGSETPKYAPIAEGTHLAVCNMLVDLGMQYNEKFGKSNRKILIGWEIPDEPIEVDGETHGRSISQRYTASLNEKSSLRRDLASWRGRDFTAEELAAFDLKTIVGTSCLINVIHKEGNNGKLYANIAGIMRLPKGMAKAAPSEPPVVFDLDKDPLDVIDTLPGFIADEIKRSSTYEERAYAEIKPPIEELTEDDESGLPF